MEGEVCKYYKFGYCKYGEICKGKHFIEECQDLSKCKSLKKCDKRHPKCCKRFALGLCPFENKCAYKHQQPYVNKD